MWTCFICTDSFDNEEYYKIHLNVCLKSWTDRERQKKLDEAKHADRDRFRPSLDQTSEDVEMIDCPRFVPVLCSIRESN